MEENKTTGSFAETILWQIRTTTPNVRLGYPPADELQRRRQERWDRERDRLLRRQEIEDRGFQRLKDAAFAQLRKDRQ